MKLYDCCKDCLDRHPLCHATCEKKKEADAVNEKRKHAKMKELDLANYAVKRRQKIKRRLGEK